MKTNENINEKASMVHEKVLEVLTKLEKKEIALENEDKKDYLISLGLCEIKDGFAFPLDVSDDDYAKLLKYKKKMVHYSSGISTLLKFMAWLDLLVGFIWAFSLIEDGIVRVLICIIITFTLFLVLFALSLLLDNSYRNE